MQENKLADLSMALAVNIVTICRDIKKEKRETILTNQLLRSGTSIGANIREANYAHGKPDFIAKLQIALKECYESEYWVELLYKTDYLSSAHAKQIMHQLGSIRRTLVASINTTKENMKPS